jgi:hypothetical protein
MLYKTLPFLPIFICAAGIVASFAVLKAEAKTNCERIAKIEAFKDTAAIDIAITREKVERIDEKLDELQLDLKGLRP